MKKWLLWIIAFVILLALFTYIFIPAKINIADSVLVKANSKGTFRCLNEGNWEKILGTTIEQHTNSFDYNGFLFKIDTGFFEEIPVNIQYENIMVKGILKCFQSRYDSTVITLRGSIDAGNNPFTRIQQYAKAQQLKTAFNDMLHKIKSYTEAEINVYGVSVVQQRVVDTFLIVTKKNFKIYPSDTVVYALIRNLKNYIAAKEIKQTNPPMLNIRIAADSSFETMVAIPIDKKTDNEGDILFKLMVPGNILVTEVKGGHNTVKQAFDAMDLYMHDHQYSAPAIPFASLVTDRMQEMDTTKWVTKIYYPIY